MNATQRPRAETGTVLIAVAFLLLLLLSFLAMGMEIGRWYLVRAELSKTVDAAALIAGKNISNPNVDPRALARDFCAANFPVGCLGTASSGAGSAAFDVQLIDGDKIRVAGRVDVSPMFSGLYEIHEVPVVSAGTVQQKNVEIVLVLDRSGSMLGKPIADLKAAARDFVDYFAATQDRNKMGLISFSTMVTLDRPLGLNYVAPMKTAIGAMTANGYTNTEDAIDKADAPGGFTDQTGVPEEAKVQQFLIFFSDGQPTAFRYLFKHGGKDYDAIATTPISATQGCASGAPSRDLLSPVTGNSIGIVSTPTGDGVSGGSTRWYIFDTYPVPGYAPTATIPNSGWGTYLCTLTQQLALMHAGELKNRNITVYTIGLGYVDAAFMSALASSPSCYYHAPTSDQLHAIFMQVAQQIALRLVA